MMWCRRTTFAMAESSVNKEPANSQNEHYYYSNHRTDDGSRPGVGRVVRCSTIVASKTRCTTHCCCGSSPVGCPCGCGCCHCGCCRCFIAETARAVAIKKTFELGAVNVDRTRQAVKALVAILRLVTVVGAGTCRCSNGAPGNVRM